MSGISPRRFEFSGRNNNPLAYIFHLWKRIFYISIEYHKEKTNNKYQISTKQLGHMS